ncbi:MAG: cobyrinate a,c-diamide synthase [Cyanobacteriota bacterium]|nr:cobyrinate a,c-diamide synthase [Cyanobacteriota bacterium]
MSLIVGGDRSSSGKTTVTLALLAYLKRQLLPVQSFKVGPDYIDPMFHSYVTGRPCRNLDPVLTSEIYVRECFARHSQTADFSLIEGVMGLFDGIPRKTGETPVPSHRRTGVSPVTSNFASVSPLPSPRRTGVSPVTSNFASVSPVPSHRRTGVSPVTSNFASTAHIALLLDLPVLLVIDCSKLSGSVAAIARGFTTFDPRIKFAGLVLNRVGSDRHLQLLQKAIAPLNLPVLGVLRRHQNITIPDRHLGLIPTDEMPELNTLIDDLARLAKDCFNWQELLPLLKSRDEGSDQHLTMHIPPDRIVTPQSEFVKSFPENKSKNFEKIVLAVARDAAFNFYYQDNLDLLEELGAELIFFSPLKETSLPPETQGLYFGGGFPEVFAKQLSENREMRESVKTAIIEGMPTYAECGGLMYLCQAIIDFNNNRWEMVGIFPRVAAMRKKLTLGYRQAIVVKNSVLLKEGDKVFAHEFHRSELTGNRSSELTGNRSSELTGNRSLELTGNRSLELTGNRSLELTGNRRDACSTGLLKIWRSDEETRESTAKLEGWQIYRVHASYLHLHWGGRAEIPQGFLDSCQQFSCQKHDDGVE